MDSDSSGGESTHIVSTADAAESIAVPSQQSAPTVMLEPTAAVSAADVVEVVAVGAGPLDQAYAAASAPSPHAKRNLMAVLGVVLAIPLWPVGLVLSTLGLLSAFNRRTGKALAAIGLVLSVLVGAAVIAALGQATSTVSSSTALDTGCKSFEAKLPADLATLKADTATLTSNIDSATSSDSSIETVSGDLAAIQIDLTNAVGEATHAAVKSDLNTMSAQLRTVSITLGDIQNHSTSSEGAAAAALTTLTCTDTEIDSLCSSY